MKKEWIEMIRLVDLTDKRIVVAGASSGIGRQTAIKLSRLGAKLILIARREDNLKKVIQELDGEDHFYYCADLSDLDSIGSLFGMMVKEHGGIDGLVYSAGITSNMPFKMTDPKKLDSVLKINFYGFVECVRQATKKGRFHSGMRIVGVSSVSSIIGKKANTGYSASKGAMDAAIRSMAVELGEKGICINSVTPGMIDTEMYREFVMQNGEDSNANLAILNRQYLGIGTTDDVANAIAFLISPAARFITGTTLVVDGGRTTN